MAKKKNSEKKGGLTPEQQDKINTYLNLVPKNVEGLTYSQKVIYGAFLYYYHKRHDVNGEFRLANKTLEEDAHVDPITVTRAKRALIIHNLIEIVEGPTYDPKSEEEEKHLATKYRLVGNIVPNIVPDMVPNIVPDMVPNIVPNIEGKTENECPPYYYLYNLLKEDNIHYIEDILRKLIEEIVCKHIEEYNLKLCKLEEKIEENKIHNTDIYDVKESESPLTTKEELKVYVESVLSDLSVCSLDDLSVLEGRLTKAAKLFNEMRKEIKTLKNELNELKKENAELIKRIGLLEKDKHNKDKQRTTNVEERKKGGLSVSFDKDKVLFSTYLKQYNDTSNSASKREEALTNLVELKNAGKLSKGQCDVLDAIFNSLKAKEKELKEKQDPSSEEHEKPVSVSVFESDTSNVKVDEWKKLYYVNETKHWEDCLRFINYTRDEVHPLIESHKASNEIVEMYNGILNGKCPMVDAIIKRNPKYTKEKVFEECRLKEKQTSKEDA